MFSYGQMDPPFIAFRRFNDKELQRFVRLRHRIDRRAFAFFGEKHLPERLVHAFAETQALPIKEVFESFEFFERVRRRVRAPHVIDLCCGHGLTGLLFAIFSRQTEAVTLVDRKKPDNATKVLDAALRIAPWIEGRVRYLEQPLEAAHDILTEQQNAGKDSSVVAVHACGKRTDRCMALAVEHRCKMALMPCCYHGTANGVPEAIVEQLGRELASDVHRTYRLEQAGYQVEWSAIPRAITDKNRILVARP